MKKFLVVFFALCAVSAFGELRRGHLSNSMGVPLIWKSGEINETDVASFTTSVSIGVSWTWYVNQVIGLYVEGDFFFPQRIAWKWDGGSMTTCSDDYGNLSLFGCSLFTGPSFALVRSPRIMFSVAPGLHCLYVHIGSNSYNGTTYYWIKNRAFGTGVNLDFSYKFTKWLYLRASLLAVYDFSSDTWVDTDRMGGRGEYTGGRTTDPYCFTLIPRLGVGFNF